MGAVVGGGPDRHRDLVLLIELCRELIKHSVSVGLVDGRPAVTVRSGGDVVTVGVEDSGAFFDLDGEERLPVDDLPGAVAAIVAHLRGKSGG